MTADFHGLPVRSLENDHLRVDYLLGAGSRLVRLILAGSAGNLLAEIPDVHWPRPGASITCAAGIAWRSRRKHWNCRMCRMTAISGSKLCSAAYG